MSENKMKVIELTADNAADYFESFYDHSALTFVGVIPEEAQLYRDYFAKYSKIDKSKPAYLYTGKMMNDHYGLTGRNAYPNDLHILTFTNDTFDNLMGIAIPRFQIGGRWFDDIVENNLSHQED